jgi:AcrR family transcriptional regulator
MAEKTSPHIRRLRPPGAADSPPAEARESGDAAASRAPRAADSPPAEARETGGATAPRTRQTADARREALVDAAVEQFSQTGLHGTAVSAITDAVGITQPYAFSLFGTKKGLFLAAVDQSFDRVEQTFREAAANAGPEGPFEAMKQSYGAVLADRPLLLMQLQTYAACGDEDVRTLARRRYAQLYDLVRELSGADGEELTQFFAAGMLLNVAAALQLPELLIDDTWLEDCLKLGDAG